ncbi:MAG: hypothetical protein KGL39_45755 [Patescibacteria group bacterium]|nr:hypothetical protein [Patescibacteria group bacterium]
MSISPWNQGSRDTITISIMNPPASFSTPTLIIHDRTGYVADTNGTGVFGAYSSGTITYTPSAADVATAGDYELFLSFYDGTGTYEYRRKMGEWLIVPV